MHIVIVGAGNIGRYLVERLAGEDHDVTVIDHDREKIEEIGSHYDVRAINAPASSLDTLKKAGVENADIFIAVTNSDEANLITCLLADSINQNVRKIARVRELVTSESGLSPRIRRVFDEFINPDREAAAYLQRVFEVPGACEVIDFANGRVRVVGVSLFAGSAVIGKKLKDLGGSNITGKMLVVAIARHGELIIPRGDDLLEVGDTIYVSTVPEQTATIFELEGREHRPVKNVIIAGGKGLGRILAANLAANDVKVKLIEPDAYLSSVLADELDGVLVLNGDPTNPTLLREEGIEDCDVFVGATLDDEENILSALLAKQLGAKTGAVSVNKSSYFNLVTTIGIDVAVSPMVAGASSILKFMRKGSVSNVFATRDDVAEVLEIVATAESKIVNKPIHDIHFPTGVIVAAVVRALGDEVTIPTGITVIHPNDRVVLFANRAVVPKLEKLLEVQLPLV